MKCRSPFRLVPVLLVCALFVVPCQRAAAQEDPNDAPLGDVARKLREQKQAPPPTVVIDNDNFSKVVEQAEQQKASGSTMVFSLEPGSKNFQVKSPDVSCSFSFSAKTSSLLADPAMLDELPREELVKLDGPATLDGDSLQVSVHNGTAWQLRELVIGLTLLRRTEESGSAFQGQAHIVPVAAGETVHPDLEASKQPDSTVLLRVKGSAAPSTTALFRTQLNFALFPDQEWHWAIVRAKGIPPAAEPATMTSGPVPLSPVPTETPAPPPTSQP